DDRSGHALLVKQPRERDRGRLFAEIGAEFLPALELRADAFVARLHALTSRGVARGDHATQHAAGERAPRDHAESVHAARGKHFELDGARGEVVEALLAHESEEMASLRGFVRLCDVPAGEVAAPDVHHLALLYEG